MAENAQLKKMGSRQEVLTLPFPVVPSLSAQTENEILKRNGAVKYDALMRQFFDAVQNILKVNSKWPQLVEWELVLNRTSTATANILTLQTSVSEINAIIAALGTSSSGIEVSFRALSASVANLTAAINAIIVLPAPYQSFPVAASTWTWNHGSGFRMAGVQAFDASWNLMVSDIQETTVNQIVATHLYNATGYLMAR